MIFNYKIYFFSLAMMFFCCSSVKGESISDTLPLAKSYSGYRLEIIGLKEMKEVNTATKKSASVDIVNSGKYPITLGSLSNAANGIQVFYDENNSTKMSLQQKEAITTAILMLERTIPAGKMERNVSISYSTEDYLSNWKNIASPKAKNKIEVKEAKISSIKQPIVEKASPVLNEKPTSIVNIPTKSIYTDEQDVKDSKKNCPDLIISELAISKKTKKTIAINFSLKNIGTAPAVIHSFKKNKTDNMTMAVYFSASDKLSRGSTLATGHIIKKGLESTGGTIPVGESFQGSIEVPLKGKSRFLNTLILQVDSKQTLYECLENNNNRSIAIK